MRKKETLTAEHMQSIAEFNKIVRNYIKLRRLYREHIQAASK